MFSLKGIPVKIIAAVLALVALVAGVYLTFFHSAGFIKTDAVILDVRNTSTGERTEAEPAMTEAAISRRSLER